MASSSSMRLVGGRTALIGAQVSSSPSSSSSSSPFSSSAAPAALGATVERLEAPQLACVCALCTCGRHACPACYVPSVGFAGKSAYREAFDGHALPECVADSREWAPNPPAPTPFLETEHRRNFTGHAISGARTGQSLGLPATVAVAAGVPFMGRSTYRTFFEDKGARVPDAVPAPPTVLRAPQLPVASAVPLLGLQQQARAHVAFKHLPATEFEMPAGVQRSPPKVVGVAPFLGTGAHAEHYPPLRVDYAHSRPESFKVHQSAASSARFEGESHSNSTHHAMDYSGLSGPVKVKKTFVAIGETRDFATTSAEALPPRQLQGDTICPAARLPRVPEPGQNPAAWVGEHVLFDVRSRTWAT
jgi:hypothetical protein